MGSTLISLWFGSDKLLLITELRIFTADIQSQIVTAQDEMRVSSSLWAAERAARGGYKTTASPHSVLGLLLSSFLVASSTPCPLSVSGILCVFLHSHGTFWWELFWWKPCTVSLSICTHVYFTPNWKNGGFVLA